MFSESELLGAFRLTVSQFKFMVALTTKSAKIPSVLSPKEMHDLVKRHMIVQQNPIPVITPLGTMILDIIRSSSEPV